MRRYWLLAGTLIALAGCGGMADSRAVSATTSAPKPVPSRSVTSAPAESRIAYVKTALANPGERDIYIAGTDGSDPHALTALPGNDVSPAWSPDGAKLAFTSTQDSDDPTNCLGENKHLVCDYEVYVINSDGSGLQRITKDGFYDREPAWSPDGQQLVYESFGKRPSCQIACTAHLVTINADGTNQQILTDDLATDHQPAWSPKGDQIAFSRGTGSEKRHIYVINLATKQMSQLTNELAFEGWPAWSPDGAHIAYMAAPSLNAAGTIRLMDADGGNDRPVKTRITPVYNYRPAWSPKGDAIAFASADEGNLNIYTVQINSGVTTRITDNKARYSGPAWSPALAAER